jgi:ChrR Cupin-like domain
VQINSNFAERVAVHAGTLPWLASPMAGVERRMLDRIGDEVARATSIVRYAPGSRFSAHVHEGGEELLVLAGVFQDGDGDCPEGYYVRNPPQSKHTPASLPGCVILVKLWQFDPTDRTRIKIDTAKIARSSDAPSGVTLIPLFRDSRENVRLEDWNADVNIDYLPAGGMELFVIKGSFVESGETFLENSWLRLPIGARLTAKAGNDGCRVWIKEGHLRYVRVPHAAR